MMEKFVKMNSAISKSKVSYQYTFTLIIDFNIIENKNRINIIKYTNITRKRKYNYI